MLVLAPLLGKAGRYRSLELLIYILIGLVNLVRFGLVWSGLFWSVWHLYLRRQVDVIPIYLCHGLITSRHVVVNLEHPQILWFGSLWFGKFSFLLLFG